jgi:hypothetical protein
MEATRYAKMTVELVIRLDQARSLDEAVQNAAGAIISRLTATGGDFFDNPLPSLIEAWSWQKIVPTDICNPAVYEPDWSHPVMASDLLVAPV